MGREKGQEGQKHSAQGRENKLGTRTCHPAADRHPSSLHELGPTCSVPLALPAPSTTLALVVPLLPLPKGWKLFTKSISITGISGLPPSSSVVRLAALPALLALAACCCCWLPPPSAPCRPASCSAWSEGSSRGGNSVASAASAASVGVAAASS